MSQTIYFATTNQRKLKEARAAGEPAGIMVEQLVFDITEIQSSDPVAVAHHKAESAFALAQRPVVVGDTSWKIPALHGFPGAYMKDVANWFAPLDWMALLRDKTDRRVAFIESIVYHDAKQIKLFSKEYWGEMVLEPRGEGGVSIEKVAAFNGKTISERRDEGKLAYDAEDYIWMDVVAWLKAQQG